MHLSNAILNNHYQINPLVRCSRIQMPVYIAGFSTTKGLSEKQVSDLPLKSYNASSLIEVYNKYRATELNNEVQ